MTTTNTIETARATYRQIRAEACAKLGITPAQFDERAKFYAYDHADGEEMTSTDWVAGAHEAAYMLGRSAA